MTSFHYAPLALVIFAACQPLCVAAGEDSDGSVTVTASPAPYSVMGKIPLTLRETPQSIQVISQQQIRQQNLQTVEEVMRHATGISVQPHHHLTTAYYSRGFEIDAWEQNGVPVMMSGVAATPEDMAMYERVEILRGASGLLHGSGNPGATVNLVRKRPQETVTFGAELSAASWDRYRAELDLGGPLSDSGNLRGRMVGVLEDRGFFWQAANQKTAMFYGTGELDLTPDTRLSAGLHYSRLRSHPPGSMGGVPRYEDGTDIGLKRQVNLESADSVSNWTTTRLFADLEQHFASGWSAKISANYLTADSYIKWLTASGGINRVTGKGAVLMGGGMKFDKTQASAGFYTGGPVTLFGRSHDLLFGANLMQTTFEQYNASLTTPVTAIAVDVFNWHPRNLPSYDTGPYTSAGVTRIRQQGIYGMGRFSLADPLTLVAGARLSGWTQHAPGTWQRINAEVTPYGGVIVDINDQWSLYGSYAQIFQPQSELDRNARPLPPVSGTNYEAGIKGELAQGALNLSLALFQIQQKNRAQRDPGMPCAGRSCYYLAGGEVRSRGIETEVAGHITPHWMLTAGYTFNTSTYLTDTQAKGLAFSSFTPRHIFRFWTSWDLPVLDRRLSVAAGIQAQSDFYSRYGHNKLTQGGYMLADVRLGWQVNSHLAVALNVNNLFDRVYYQRLSSPAWSNYYGEPRNFMLTLHADY